MRLISISCVSFIFMPDGTISIQVFFLSFFIQAIAIQRERINQLQRLQLYFFRLKFIAIKCRSMKIGFIFYRASLLNNKIRFLLNHTNVS